MRDVVRQLGYECGALTTWRCECDGKFERLNTQENVMNSPDLGTGVVYFGQQALHNLLVDKVIQLGGQVN